LFGFFLSLKFEIFETSINYIMSSYSSEDSTCNTGSSNGSISYFVGQLPTTATTTFTFAPTAEQNEWFEYFNGAFIGGVVDCLSTTMAIANTPNVHGLMVSLRWCCAITYCRQQSLISFGHVVRLLLLVSAAPILLPGLTTLFPMSLNHLLDQLWIISLLQIVGGM
jgi:hypothetical protein